MKTLRKNDIKIVSHLRRNSRERLTTISRKTSIPVSTIFDKMKMHYGRLITKHTALLDFSGLGFNARANIMVRVDKRKRDELKQYLMKHTNVNSLYKINNGYDFMIEAVFRDIKELEAFSELLDDKFSAEKDVYYIVDDIKRESFLSEPESMKLVDV